MIESGEMIDQILAAPGGLRYENFISAAGIKGNLKIDLITALKSLETVRYQIVSSMSEILEEADVITGAPTGGLKLAAQVAHLTGKPLIKMEKFVDNGRINFRVSQDVEQGLLEDEKVGLVEDVTTTRISMLKTASIPQLSGRVIMAVSAIRRGVKAPLNMNPEMIDRYNSNFTDKPPLEHKLPFDCKSVIDLPLPLMVSTHDISEWLRESRNRGHE